MRAGLVLSANGDPARFSGFPGPVLPDPVPDQPGPLAGILAGLEHAAARGVARVVSVSGDAPFLPGDLVARLDAAGPETGIALAASGERQHYTIALWPTALRDALRAYLERGERRVGAFIARRGPRWRPGRSSRWIRSSTSTRRRIWQRRKPWIEG